MKQSPACEMIVDQLVKKFSDHFGLEGSLPCAQEPVTLPYFEPDVS